MPICRNAEGVHGTRQFGNPCSITSYKDFDQTSTTTQHSINQPCSESVKFGQSVKVLRPIFLRFCPNFWQIKTCSCIPQPLHHWAEQ